MKLLLLFSLFFACLNRIGAQNTKAVTIPADTHIMDVLSVEDIFSYPLFTSGKVFFRSGFITEAKLNYNKLVDEMHFITPKGDTLAVTDEKTIKYIVIGKDTFYYDQGYVRLITGNNALKLALKQGWRISDTRKIGAFNTANNTSSITTYINFSNPSKVYDLVVNEDVILSGVNAYFLGDMNGHFLQAGKKNLLTLIPREEKRIEMYLKKNKVDFNNKEDLEKILQYLEN